MHLITMSKCIKQKSIKLQDEIDKLIIIVSDFNKALLVTNRTITLFFVSVYIRYVSYLSIQLFLIESEILYLSIGALGYFHLAYVPAYLILALLS